MNDFKKDLIRYRLEKCKEAYSDANLLFGLGRWNLAVNRLYYSCFYIVSALALQNGIKGKSHSGLMTQFHLHFVKTNMVSLELSNLYSDLFDYRQKGDYSDFFYHDKKTVGELLPKTLVFI